jgi:formate dehydrogenase alpha subunit
VTPLSLNQQGELSMSKQSEPLGITIDNRQLQAKQGMTILQAAEKHDIYIPTLCAHKDLTAFGGCRMCIVEVEGMRGFPTSCTTPIQEGMIVRTQTSQVNAIRTEILQLILSEHPVSCLICDESEECKKYNVTTRKVGVTTGCRYCPNDNQCELHDVAEKLGIKEIGYPILYRNMPVEKDDPFFDRDYNLCILCGRCVRMCQEIRTAGTLAFKKRGHLTTIGPAYDRTHLEAGCEFCGACVSVCPTGALSEKTKKWEGKADREQTTTCAFCGIGCQVRLQIKGDEIIGSLPADDPLVNNGQLCVKGRFCVTETVNDYRRLKRPYKTVGITKVDIPFDEAIDIAAQKLSECPPEDFGMIVSPNCTNEDLYVAQKFARAAMGSNNIDTSARIFYGPSFNSYINLIRKAVPLSTLRKSSIILCIGLDTRFARSVAGVELRIATRRGAKLITINSHEHNLSLIADKKLYPSPEEMLDLLGKLVTAAQNGNHASTDNDEIDSISLMLKEADSPVILIGPDLLNQPDSPSILDMIAGLAKNINAGILPLPAHNNLLGSMLLGAYPELLPGGMGYHTIENLQKLRELWNLNIPDTQNQWDSISNDPNSKRKVLYLIGEAPFDKRPSCDFLIYQNIFHPPSAYAADIVFPSAAFTEIDGSFINGEGRIQKVMKGVNPPGEAKADWEIICQIARKMGKSGFEFATADEIRNEIANFVEGFKESNFGSRMPLSNLIDVKMNIPAIKLPLVNFDQYPFKFDLSLIEHAYRGYPLTNWVSGLKSLYVEGVLNINPDDAKNLGISAGDNVIVSSTNFEKTWPANIFDGQQQGRVSVTLPMNESPGFMPQQVNLSAQPGRKSNV